MLRILYVIILNTDRSLYWIDYYKNYGVIHDLYIRWKIEINVLYVLYILYILLSNTTDIYDNILSATEEIYLILTYNIYIYIYIYIYINIYIYIYIYIYLYIYI